VTRNPSTASRFTRHPSISPSLINTIPSPNNQNQNQNHNQAVPSPNNNPYTNGSSNPNPNLNGEEVGISPPMFRVTSRFENEEEARRARERLYREGLAGRTLVHGHEEEVQEGVRGSPESERSEELWPGSY